MVNMVLEQNIPNGPTHSSEISVCQPIIEETPVILDKNDCNNNELDLNLIENCPIILNIDSTLTVNTDDKNVTFTDGLNLNELPSSDFSLEEII